MLQKKLDIKLRRVEIIQKRRVMSYFSHIARMSEEKYSISSISVLLVWHIMYRFQHRSTLWECNKAQ